MTIMIVADTYPEYRNYRKYQFPYYTSFGPDGDKDFTYIDPRNVDTARSIQRGNVYIHLSGGLPEWFTQRFTRLEIKDSPRHHSFGIPYGDEAK